jgi:hypothetical protein
MGPVINVQVVVILKGGRGVLWRHQPHRTVELLE